MLTVASNIIRDAVGLSLLEGVALEVRIQVPFLGLSGAHYFYSGRFGMGVLFLLTMGFFGIGWAVDLVRIAVGKFPDRFGYYI